jgi:hypothetical protein
MKMQETATQAATHMQATVNTLLACVNQTMARLAVIEKLQAVPPEVREPQRKTAMENCDKERKKPPKTHTSCSKRREVTREKCIVWSTRYDENANGPFLAAKILSGSIARLMDNIVFCQGAESISFKNDDRTLPTP